MGDVLRILDRFRITGRGVVYTVKISKGCIIHIGDVLLDLRGNRFEVSGIEMFRGIIAEGKSFEDMPLGLMFKQLDGVEAYGNILVKDLNDINFIFCNHPLYQRKVDEDYEVEYQEAGLHHSCALFSYEDMERGTKNDKIRSFPTENLPDFFQVLSKKDSFLPFFRRQSLFDHKSEKSFQVIVVTVQVIEDTGGIKLF